MLPPPPPVCVCLSLCLCVFMRLICLGKYLCGSAYECLVCLCLRVEISVERVSCVHLCVSVSLCC